MGVTNKYAQLDADSIVVATLETPGEIDAPHMIPYDGGDVIGKRWNGATFEDVLPSPLDLARAELASIDAKTGMSRAQREAWIATGVPLPYLAAQEARAAELRAIIAAAVA